MSIQLMWKRLKKNDAPLSLAMSLFRLPLFNEKPHIKSAYFCTETTIPSLTPPNRGVARELLINKCGLTDEEITKAFRHRNQLLCAKSGHNMEEALELLNGCGLTTPAQIRKVVLHNPNFLFYKSEKNLKSKLNLFKSYMNEKDITKFVQNGAKAFDASEERIKSIISLLQKLGMEGEALSHLLARYPRIFASSEEKIKRNVDFVVDTVGLPLIDFIKYPPLFSFSLETRMVPRYRVLKAMDSIQVQVLKRRLCFPKILELTEKNFLEKYVNSNAESSSVLQDIYIGGKDGKLSLSKRHSVGVSQ